MKTKNLVLSVLILLLAAVSVTAGYLLFAKRSELASGWNKMASAINRSSSELDHNSGSDYAKSLTVGDLSPFSYSTLDKSLAKYQDQVRKVAANRNKLVATLAGVALKSDLTGVSEDDLRKVDSAESNAAKVVKAFNSALQLRDRNFKQMISLVKSDLGAEISAESLVAGDVNAFVPADNAVNAIRSRNYFYEGKLKDIAVMVEVPVSFGSQYEDGARNIAEAVDRLRATSYDLRNELVKVRQENEALRQAFAQNASDSTKLNTAIAQKKQDAKIYKEKLGIDANADPIPWENGSKEARAALVGRIIKVNANYGYVAIDLGTDTVVHQPMGKGFVAVNPRISKGMNVLIYRGSGKNSRTIARLVLNEVGDNVSTANITSETPAVKVGDLVRCEFYN